MCRAFIWGYLIFNSLWPGDAIWCLINWFKTCEIWIQLRNFISQNEFENAVCKMSAILSRPQCVKWVVVTNEKVTAAATRRHSGFNHFEFNICVHCFLQVSLVVADGQASEDEEDWLVVCKDEIRCLWWRCRGCWNISAIVICRNYRQVSV